MKKALMVVVIITLVGCASTTYKEFVEGNPVIGKGGTREIIEGIEVWENGAPNKQFVVIGIINDQRPGAVIPRMTRIPDIAKKAKEAKGDAVIIYSEGTEVAGYVNNSFGGANAAAYRSGNTVTTDYFPLFELPIDKGVSIA